MNSTETPRAGVGLRGFRERPGKIFRRRVQLEKNINTRPLNKLLIAFIGKQYSLSGKEVRKPIVLEWIGYEMTMMQQ